MRKGKQHNNHGSKKQQNKKGSPHHTNKTHAVAAGGIAHTDASPTQRIDRTRTKLPTKRKRLRQEEAFAEIPPPEDYEIVISVPDTPPYRHNNMPSRNKNGDGSDTRTGKPDRGRKIKVKGHGFSMREEALNTNDNYQKRSWMEDKRSTLRHQNVTFVEGGVLSNKPPTPASTESEAESSQSGSAQGPEEIIMETTAIIPDELEALDDETFAPSTARMGPSSPRPMQLDSEDVAIDTDDSISHLRPPSSISETKHTTTPQPPPTIPLPPIQFISTEENIVFTPRNQRRNPSHPKPPQALTNWDVPATFKAMTETSSPNWTKPRKKQNRRKGHKQFAHLAEEEGEIVLEGGGVRLGSTADDALLDYLENIRAQGESEGEVEYLERMLMVEDGEDGMVEDVGEVAMGELSLDGRRSRSVEMRGKSVSGIGRVALSESATPLRVGTPEESGPLNSAVLSEMEEEAGIPRKVRRTKSQGVWIVERVDSEEESSENNTQDEDEWTDEEETIIKGKNMEVSSTESQGETMEDDDEDDESEDEDDDDEDEDDEEADLDEDEDIIANMILDDYDLDGLDLDLDLDIDLSSTRFRRNKKSITRQPNVPALPSDDDEIISHLQSLWKQDRLSKKERKQERERARLLGLLGSKPKSKGKKARRAARREELERINALDGAGQFSIQKINDDIRGFWEDEDALDFALPPMDRIARKMIHELANAYNLSSKSHGAGKSRFTTLFKTQQTDGLALNEHKIRSIIKRASWVEHPDKSARGRGEYASSLLNKAVKKHKEGHVVGGDAKELGLDNRGRVMLEKLGWRSGMGLGAEGMGMKLPIFAVIKSSKSGLQ